MFDPSWFVAAILTATELETDGHQVLLQHGRVCESRPGCALAVQPGWEIAPMFAAKFSQTFGVAQAGNRESESPSPVSSRLRHWNGVQLLWLLWFGG